MPTDKRNRQVISGDVVKIRLDTTDIMTCIQVLEMAGMDRPGMGLSQAIKWGIVSMAETIRRSGVLPEVDGFDYARLTERYTKPEMGVRVKVGIQLAAEEVPFKMSNRSAAIPASGISYPLAKAKFQLPDEDDEDDEELLKIPADVRAQLSYSTQDIVTIGKRMRSQDVNITGQERAAWLLLSPIRTAWDAFMTREELSETEDFILKVWPSYPKLS